MNKDVEEFLASFPFAETTKATYARVLEELVRLPLEKMMAADLLVFINRDEWGNSRRCVALAASQRFIAWRYGVDHPALNARVKRMRSKRQRVLSADQALQLLASFDTSTAKGSRDLALAALALDTGLRCAELCRLQLGDVDLERRNLQVVVKGGQWNWATFSAETAQYIREWVAWRHGHGDLRRELRPEAEGRRRERAVFQERTAGDALPPHDLIERLEGHKGVPPLRSLLG